MGLRRTSSLRHASPRTAGLVFIVTVMNRPISQPHPRSECGNIDQLRSPPRGPFPIPIAGEYSEAMQARLILLLVSIVIAAGTLSAPAQDKGTLNPQPLPPLEHPNDPKIAAKQLFARKILPSAQPTKVIGEYTKGCIAGAARMPTNGDTWQVMRLSRKDRKSV